MNASSRNLVDLCFHGYWFCEHCDRIVDHLPAEAESPQRCPYCKKRMAVWKTPAFTEYEKITVGSQLVGGGAGQPVR